MDIDEAIDEIKKDMINFLIKIINIPTENPPGLNYEKFVDYMYDFLISLDYNIKIVEPKEELKELVKYGSGRRPNIIANYGNKGVKIGFNSHYDVVPAGKGWSHDPYNATIEEGKIYGRGSSDMKSGIASQIFAVEALKIMNNIKDKITIRQFIVPDEETVGNKNAGTYYLVEKGFINKENLNYLIFTEPLNPTNIGIGHRGALWGTFNLYGKKSHGGFPQKGLDVIRCASKIINYIYEIADKRSKTISKYPIIPEEAKRPSYLVGTINGGEWMNTVADFLTFSYVRRLIPEETLEFARNEVNEIIKYTENECKGIKIEFLPYYEVDNIMFPVDNGVKIISEKIKEVYNVNPSIVLSPGTFDIRFIYNKGIESFNYGPGLLELAHATDEYVYVEDLIKSTKVISLFLKEFLNK
ncbi:acetylornithine deacetylase or succinyl-diaminopimelate desuccinylase [Caldisphaera lagunensis DSM 15908]|uniref:Probable succinyl-diaminopimelate desuccinylase n=1 Tax=Caldisphaera lagunensis (strain DSM 15908 / JCM 11604 / ANMR 0165 / IC-154) TaxID=1056495 RepID=L0A809_CALLD|nr:M20 family metallopeptidase [Caldisphaera lagunensis]AFZ69966.1 acetylornithine deacetylase or succinyl-diaminopimelate desuccinylase [Caldisphaera lagunensis DSM 15908]